MKREFLLDNNDLNILRGIFRYPLSSTSRFFNNFVLNSDMTGNSCRVLNVLKIEQKGGKKQD